MVNDRGPAGCPGARLKPGGWGAVVAEEVQMTWLTWKEMGSSGAHALLEGPPEASQSLPSETPSSCWLWNAGSSSLSAEVTVMSLQTRWLAQLGQEPPLGSAAAVGLLQCQLVPITRTPLVPCRPSVPSAELGALGILVKGREWRTQAGRQALFLC